MEDALEKISRLEFQAQSQFVPQVEGTSEYAKRNSCWLKLSTCTIFGLGDALLWASLEEKIAGSTVLELVSKA